MNKVAIITGAGTGVGKATAVKLSDAGFSVILIGRRKNKLDETKTACNNEAIVIPMDVSNETEVKKCFELVEKEFSRVDLLFNNAGTFLSSKTIDKINFTLFIEYFESAFVNDDNDFSSTSTFWYSNIFNSVGRRENVTIKEVNNPNDIIRPKSIIGFMSLKIKDRNAHIVVRTV